MWTRCVSERAAGLSTALPGHLAAALTEGLGSVGELAGRIIGRQAGQQMQARWHRWGPGSYTCESASNHLEKALPVFASSCSPSSSRHPWPHRDADPTGGALWLNPGGDELQLLCCPGRHAVHGRGGRAAGGRAGAGQGRARRGRGAGSRCWGLQCRSQLCVVPCVWRAGPRRLPVPGAAAAPACWQKLLPPTN